MKKRPVGLPVENGNGPIEASPVAEAASCLRQGGIVAVPTETFYGLAVDPFNEKALQALFRLKKREPNKPILVLISDMSQLDDLVESIPTLYLPLIERFWPGPLTLIFPGSPTLSSLLTGGTGTVGVRISSNFMVGQLCRISGGPITATSANPSGMAPAASAAEVRRMFGYDIDYIVNDGPSPGGKCSTVIGLRGGCLNLIRDGQIDFSLIKQALHPNG